MSSSKKRSEFIERIRYPNPLPLPPYPPKLLSIPTPFQRFTDPRNFGPRLAQNHPLPVVVDAEAGMPLNLTDFPQAWYTDQELEADDQVFPQLDRNEVDIDPEDAFLLSDILEKLPGTNNGIDRREGGPGGSGVVSTDHITWLRRTEYLAAEQQKRKRNENLDQSNEVIDCSREGQLKRIKQSFDVANQPIDSIRHPNKPGIRAIESYTILPDPDTWATQYNVFRFGDHPGRLEDNKPIRDPRLETAILRPHADLVDQPIYSLFLIHAPEMRQEGEADDEDRDGSQDLNNDERPKRKNQINLQTVEERRAIEDAEAARYKESRVEGEKVDAEERDIIEAPFDTEESEQTPTQLGHVRDYEAHDESNRKDLELIFTYVDTSLQSENEELRDGTLPAVSRFEKRFRSNVQDKANGAASYPSSDKVVYYHPVTSRAALRVRRRRANDPLPPEHWDAIALQKRSLSMYEKIERLHQRAVVDDMDMKSLPERIELPAEEAIEEHQEGEVQAKIDSRPQDNILDDGSDDDERERGKINDEDEDEQDNRTESRKKISAIRSDDEDDGGEDEDENRKGSGSDDEDGSRSGDSALQSDEEMDEDELAALQAEAGVEAKEQSEEEEAGSRRRSRRAAATAPTGGEEKSKPREPLSMDVDEED